MKMPENHGKNPQDLKANAQKVWDVWDVCVASIEIQVNQLSSLFHVQFHTGKSSPRDETMVQMLESKTLVIE